MRHLTSFLRLTALLAAALLSGCSGSNSGVAQAKQVAVQAPQAAKTAQAPRMVVFGVDRTERYEVMTKPALALAEQALLQAAPGDELVFRWISDRSYRSDELIVLVKLPEVPRVRNQFDPREKTLAHGAMNRLRAEVQRGLQALRAQAPSSGTSSTDLYGFITSAAEHFSLAPSGLRKVLVIASDMEDNRRYNIRPNLSGVEVQIYLLVIEKQPDPAQFAQLKARWARYFLEHCGAARVDFLPVKRSST